MWKINVKVRSYRPGKALSEELRSNIIDRLSKEVEMRQRAIFPDGMWTLLMD